MDKIALIVPPVVHTKVIRDYAAGLGFEQDSNYFLPPLDLLQLASCIEKEIKTIVIDGQVNSYSNEQILTILQSNDINFCIVEFTITTIEDDIHFTNFLVENQKQVIVRINTQNKEILDFIFQSTNILYCIVGECEDNIVDILNNSTKEGIAEYTNGQVTVHKKEFIKNLNSIPFPVREKVLNNQYIYPKLGECATLLSSRGCPYSCKYYCPYPLVQGTTWRHKNTKTVIDELKSIVALGINKILFRDAVFTLNKKRIIEICNKIIDEQLTINWWCETRIDCLSHDLIELMHKAGCVGINVGIESGNEQLRFSLLKEGLSNEMIISITQKANQVGIKIAFLLMIGFPDETKKDILLLAHLLKIAKPFDIGISFPVPYKGTEFEKIALKQNLYTQDIEYKDLSGDKIIVKNKSMNQNDLLLAKKLLLDYFQAIKNNRKDIEEETINQIEIWSRI